MRNAFADEITKAAIIDERIVLLSGDIGNKLFDSFKQAAPKRIYNCGVAEANMTGMAAGLAMIGFRPFTYTITPFATVRCLEQIRIDICYQNLPVTIVGTGSGLSYTELGPTHHSCDDIGLLRMLPNISIVCPCDPIEARLAIRASLNQNGPVYIRLGKKGEPQIHHDKFAFLIGKSITVRKGNDICILSTGNVMPLSLKVANELIDLNINARVESFHTIKPLDVDLLINLFDTYHTIVTIEEHSLIGGLGSAIAEWMIDNNHIKTKLLRIGTRDEFLPYVGSQDYARQYYGLTSERIINQILDKIN
ncbi:MAG: hypothetical protein ACD_46C00180G0002 [uncultured bacterium]|nr:MAG: hypothetical protein ACD_46C00180G0002 [uncultured bacterium]